MYPDLSYFFHDLFGIAPDNGLSVFKTFGLFLVLAFLASAYVLYLELKRKESIGQFKAVKGTRIIGAKASPIEIASNALFGFIIGFKLVYLAMNFPEFKLNPAAVLLSTKGNLIAGLLAALGFGFYRYWDAKRNSLDKAVTKEVDIHPYERVGDITMVAAISGIIGARLFSILENMESFLNDPIGQIFSGSGLTIYGGLILAFITVYWYIKKRGMKPIHMMDATAPAVMMGYAVGRMGCQLSGDGDWGIPNSLAKPDWFIFPDWAWSYDYARNVINEGSKIPDCINIHCSFLNPGVFPTPLYEVIFSLISFAILWSLRKRFKKAGMIFSLYLILNGIERFFIEFIRVNEKYEFLGQNWSQAQYIAIGFLILGIIGLILCQKNDWAKET